MEISRRNFIKAGAIGTVALGVSGGVFAADKWMRPVEAAEDHEEKIICTYHPPDCGGRCSHRCTVRDGRLVKIEPNDWPDERYSRICLKGLSEVEHVYSAERLQTPLKRVGERGEGKFVPITWDEALTTIANKINELKGRYGAESILFSNSFGVDYAMPFLPALLGAQVTVGQGIDVGLANGLEEATGDFYYGAMYNEITDWVNSRTIILLGTNILETILTDSRFFYDAKDAGAKVISIDPAYSTTVAKSDQWVRIKPGTDGALLLSMIHVILENNWHQKEYLLKNSSAPFLVHSDNQKLLRQKEAEEGSKTNPFLVWDDFSGSLKPYNAPGIKARLEGEFTVNGVKVKTVLTALKEKQKQYTPAWAAKITGIPEETIQQVAHDYALNGPAVLAWGFGGPDKWGNADVTGHAGAILGALTANIGREGGGVGCPIGHYITWSATLNSWKLPEQFKTAPIEMIPSEMRHKPNSVKALINTGNTIQQHFGNLNQTDKWIKSLEFVVSIAPYHNVSVDYADIVLPACTSYESEYEINNLQIAMGHVLLQQKVLEPLFESKSDFQIEKELAAKFGLDQYLPKTPMEYQRTRLNSGDPFLKGITIETLLENNCVMRLNSPNEPFVGHKDQVYNTPSGKLELYFEKMIEDNQAFPAYEDPQEASVNNSLYEKYPLQFSQAHTRYRVHSQFVESKWINQIDPEPRVEMHPRDAEERGLSNGDLVEVFNDRGSFQARCKFNNAMQPGLIRQYEGWWTKHMAEGNIQNLTNDKINSRQTKLRYGPVVPYNDTLAQVRKA